MRYMQNISYFCNSIFNNLTIIKMKSTFIAIVALGIVALAGCGSSASTDNKADSAVASPASQPKEAVVETANNPASVQGGKLVSEGKVIKLDKKLFIENVFDFENNPEKWNYVGSKPCIIDFYADWCRPCKMIAPIMDELAAKYKDQIVIYKVNTDEQREIAQAFGVRSLPTVLFCPMEGTPQMTQGALPKEQFEEVLNKVLLTK